jgi:hypothetical protein
VLTDLQRRIAIAVSEVAEGEGFALAGGAALIFQGLVDRRTRDLDFFTVDTAAVNRVGPEVEIALRSKGMDVVRRVDAPGFVRLEVSEGGEICEVDFGSDARLRPEIKTELGPMVATEELAADKTLALFGRAAARDFVDVFALSQIFGQDRLLELAAEKDRGFDQRHFAEALGAFTRLDRDLFGVSDEQFAAIREFSTSWRYRILDRTMERPTKDHGDDLGLGL